MTLLDVFRGTVWRYPEEPAVRDGDQMLTYQELDAYSDSFAQTLRDRGVGVEDRVAYCLERGARVFVALLGILKAGAAYVPVDSRYPDVRRDLMISSSRPSLVITEPGWTSRLSGLATEVLELRIEDCTKPPHEELPAAAPEQAAAVLFTSGSSGTPKAVVLEHRNLVHFATNPCLPGLAPGDRVGHVSSLSFDAFHWETWCAFAGGAEITVLPTMPDLITQDIQRELKRRRITAMLVPTMALNHVMLENREAFGSLRVLCTGGDVVLPTACRELLASTFAGQLFNLYGPTEGTTACTAHHVVEVPEDAVPIGRALEGLTLHVLGPNRSPVGDGQTGELYIEGPSVARGYLDQPELTEEKFPPGASAPGRMYATGDLVRRGADGVLDYLGRADDQVKIRGYRIEPREVERILARYPSVREVAIVTAGTGGDKHLVALICADDSLSLDGLREHAKQQMPDFMVPSSLTRVAEIPANSHGKRDLKALRALAEEHLARHAGHIPPRDKVERLLAGVWRDLLKVERVGAEDDFYALGGNSLLSFRMLRRITRELDVQLSAREILATSRLEDLAQLVRDRKEATPA